MEATDLKFDGQLDCVQGRVSVKFGRDQRFGSLARDHSSFFSPKSLLLGNAELHVPFEILHTVRRVLCKQGYIDITDITWYSNSNYIIDMSFS